MSGLEILGIAAAVLQIADLGARLSVKLFTFSRKIKSADQSIKTISQDIAATGAVLQQLAAVLKKDEELRLCSDQAVKTAKVLVDDCNRIFSELDEALDNRTTSNKYVSAWKDRLKYPFLEPQIELLQSNLERLKSSLIVMLNVLIYAEQLRNHETLPLLQEQKTLIQVLVEDRNTTSRKFEQLQKAIEQGSTSVNISASKMVFMTQGIHPSSTKSAVHPPPVPNDTEQREVEINHHGALVESLLSEINESKYNIGHGTRSRMHQGVLKTHWDEWSPYRKLFGHTNIMRTIASYSEVSHYWLRKIQLDIPARGDVTHGETTPKHLEIGDKRNVAAPDVQRPDFLDPERPPWLSSRSETLVSDTGTDGMGQSNDQEPRQKTDPKTVCITQSSSAARLRERRDILPPPPPPPLDRQSSPMPFLPPPPRPLAPQTTRGSPSSMLNRPQTETEPMLSSYYLPSGDSFGLGVPIPRPVPEWQRPLTPPSQRNVRTHRGDALLSSEMSKTAPDVSASAGKWPLERVLRWLQAHSFSRNWQDAFQTLRLEGESFLQLGQESRGRAALSLMHQVLYPELAKACTRSGSGWDQAREREEGKRLRQLVALEVREGHSSRSENASDGRVRERPQQAAETLMPMEGPDEGHPQSHVVLHHDNTRSEFGIQKERPGRPESFRTIHGRTAAFKAEKELRKTRYYETLSRSGPPPKASSKAQADSQTPTRSAGEASDSGSDADSDDGLFSVPLSSKMKHKDAFGSDPPSLNRPTFSYSRPRASLSSPSSSRNAVSFSSDFYWTVRAPLEDIEKNMDNYFPECTSGMPAAIVVDFPTRPKASGSFVLGRVLGASKSSRVQMAGDPTTGQVLAIKTLIGTSIETTDDSDGQLEARLSSITCDLDRRITLQHPNLVECLGYDKLRSSINVYLEYLSGCSVEACLRNYGSMEESVIQSITHQALTGLRYLHQKGIFHQNLTARKLLLDLSGRCKLSGFGMARHSEIKSGPVLWMAPEVGKGKGDSTEKADIWALGYAALEMFSGRLPWANLEARGNPFHLGTGRMPPIPENVTERASAHALAFLYEALTVDPQERPTAQVLLQHSPFCEMSLEYDFQKTKLYNELDADWKKQELDVRTSAGKTTGVQQRGDRQLQQEASHDFTPADDSFAPLPPDLPKSFSSSSKDEEPSMSRKKPAAPAESTQGETMNPHSLRRLMEKYACSRSARAKTPEHEAATPPEREMEAASASHDPVADIDALLLEWTTLSEAEVRG